MAGGQNILAGKKVRAAPEFMCGHTIILLRHSILQPHRVVNDHGPQFRRVITLGNVHDRMNQRCAGHLDDLLESKFGDALTDPLKRMCLSFSINISIYT